MRSGEALDHVVRTYPRRFLLASMVLFSITLILVAAWDDDLP
jgi:hypothetical protein